MRTRMYGGVGGEQPRVPILCLHCWPGVAAVRTVLEPGVCAFTSLAPQASDVSQFACYHSLSTTKSRLPEAQPSQPWSTAR